MVGWPEPNHNKLVSIHADSSTCVSRIWLDSKPGGIRIGTQTKNIRLHSLPVRPQGGQGPTKSRTLQTLN